MSGVSPYLLYALAAAAAFPHSGSAEVRVAVIAPSNFPAYTEALEAFHKSLRSGGITVTSFDPDQNQDRPGTVVKRVLNGLPNIIVVFGAKAAEALAAVNTSVPLIVSMVLEDRSSTGQNGSRRGSIVSLALPPGAVLDQLRVAFPNRKRLGVAAGPRSGATITEVTTEARRRGYGIEVVDCKSAGEVLRAIATLRERTDLLWCLPDQGLYQPGTIEPLILASLRHHLPLVGFSENFVRAGALIGFYPDYADIGIQTAELVRRQATDPRMRAFEVPRKLRIALNERVLRVLGAESPALTQDVLVVR